VVLEPRLRAKNPTNLVARIEALGGTVETSVDAHTTMLIIEVGARTSDHTRALKLIAKGAEIEIVDATKLVERHAPSADEVLALLRGGTQGIAQLAAMLECPWNVPGFPMPSLGKADLRKLSLRDARLYRLALQDADLREADLAHCSLESLTGCDLRGATLDHATVSSIERCDLRGASLRHASPYAISDSDLRDATLEGVSFSYRELKGCNLEGIDLSRGDLSHIKLAGANLRKARLAEAQLGEADLSEADLSGADLCGAMLTKAKLTKAKLDGVSLAKANLGGADLTGASLDGADFTEANLAGATLPSKGTAKAKGLKEALEAVGGEIGPRLRELAPSPRRPSASRPRWSSTCPTAPRRA